MSAFRKGDLICEKEGRHIGEVTSILQFRRFKVRWQENGFVSYLNEEDIVLYYRTSDTGWDYGPGYYRLHGRLGPQQTEALRQQVLEEQKVALEEAAKTHTSRDRDWYKDYPKPKR